MPKRQIIQRICYFFPTYLVDQYLVEMLLVLPESKSAFCSLKCLSFKQKNLRPRSSYSVLTSSTVSCYVRVRGESSFELILS